jgi:hypothetical protein
VEPVTITITLTPALLLAALLYDLLLITAAVVLVRRYRRTRPSPALPRQSTPLHPWERDASADWISSWEAIRS